MSSVLSIQACLDGNETSQLFSSGGHQRQPTQLNPQLDVHAQPSSSIRVVIRRKGKDGLERASQFDFSSQEIRRELEKLKNAERTLSSTTSKAIFERASLIGNGITTVDLVSIDTTAVIEGNTYRLLATPSGLTDVMELLVNDSAFSQSLVHYEVNGGIATAFAMAGINHFPSLGLTAEVYLGSETIESYGGHALENYEFLEVVDGTACAAAVIAYAVAYGWLVYEIAGARNPLKLPGIFGRVSLRVGTVIGTALAIDVACNEPAT